MVEIANFEKGHGRNSVKITQREAITKFQQIPGKADEVTEYTAKTLYDAVKDMSSEAYANFVLDARLKMDAGEN